MSVEITSDDFVAKSSDVLAGEEAKLLAAQKVALAELERIQEKVAAKGKNHSPYPDFELYETPAGIGGRYVIMQHKGWRPLIELIGFNRMGEYHSAEAQRAIVANIDFSANVYPGFDGVIGEHFQSPYLLDPMDDKFESFKGLRDNIAAVRNFLLETYFTMPPEGMTNEKAKESLKQIAGYVGDGLYNNWLFLGLVPNHDPRKPFIDIKRASAANGEGAQYIYDKILEMQRQSGWRMFEAVKELFGGKKLHDWGLPSSEHTTFRKEYEAGIAEDSLLAQEHTAEARLAAIDARMAAIRDARSVSNIAVDLDSIGNYLTYTAMHQDGVAQLSDGKRREAIEHAHEILRKLKLGIGEIKLIDGLKMKPSDDLETLGAVKGVAMVYERLTAWARANNATDVFQNPAVIAATQAIGQLGYQAKREALRMAQVAKNGVLANAISEQLERMPAAYRQMGEATFGSLLEKIESGMSVILNRTQQVSVNGTKLGNSIEDAPGQTLSTVPTAGMGQQMGMDDAARRNAETMLMNELSQQAMAQRIHAQTQATLRQQQPHAAQQQPQASAPQPAPRASGGVGRQSVTSAQAARRSTQQAVASASAPANPAMAALTPAQQQMLARQAQVAAAADAARKREQEQRMQEQQRQQIAQRDAATRTAKRAAQQAAQRIDPGMLKGFQSATSLNGVMPGTPVVTGGRAIRPEDIRKQAAATAQAQARTAANNATATPAANKPVTSGAAADDKLLNPSAITPGQNPNNRGSGRGF